MGSKKQSIRLETVDDILTALPEQMLSMEPIDQIISLYLYRRLAEGQPFHLKDLRECTTKIDGEIAVSLARLSPEIKYDGDGRLVAFMGLSLTPTSIKLSFNDNVLYAWCAWDSLFIPHILGETLQITAFDHRTRAVIEVDVHNGNGVSANPSSTVVTFPSPSSIDNDHLNVDTVGAFCSHVRFFESEASAASWIESSGLGNVLILDLASAYELGIKRNHIRFPQYLNPENLAAVSFNHG